MDHQLPNLLLRCLLPISVAVGLTTMGCVPTPADSCTMSLDCPSGDRCVDGMCVITDDPDGGVDVCEAPYELCGDSCIDTSDNLLHCGACGAACGAGESCIAGACEAAADCEGQVCREGCVDTSTDENNCGGCGVVCDGTCIDGACCGEERSGTTACGEECVEYAWDVENCGACGVRCAAGELCGFGVCFVPTESDPEPEPETGPEVDPTLVAWYAFEEGSGNVVDSSGNGHDGAVNGVIIRGAPGRVGNAIRLDGNSGSGIRIPNPTRLRLTNEVTIEAWVKTDRCQQQTVVFRDRNFDLEVDGDCSIEGGLDHTSGGWYMQSPNDLLVTRDRWTHLALVYDGEYAGNWQLYVDGRPSQRYPLGTNLDESSAEMTIGFRPNGGWAFSGYIDEVKIYRSVRGPAQICEDAGRTFQADGRCR